MSGDSRDTSAEAADIQARIVRSKTGEQRLQLAFDMSMTTRALITARLASEHPDWDEARLQRELLRTIYRPEELPPEYR